MTKATWAKTTLVLLFAITAAAPGYAVAEPPVPDAKACGANTGPCAVLYETTENLSLRALRTGHRKATSSLLGFAVRGTPLCPDHLMPVVDPLPAYCALNVTGADNISLTTGLGQFRGDVSIVVQEVNPVTEIPTPDSPELVIARGKFTGMMNFAPAILDQIPLGSVDGHLSLDGFTKRVPFTGVFRLPFLFPPTFGDAPVYLLNPPSPIPFDMNTWAMILVAGNEMAIGYPTVRFEIFFSF